MKKCKENIGDCMFTPTIFKYPRTRHVGDAAEDVSNWGKQEVMIKSTANQP